MQDAATNLPRIHHRGFTVVELIGALALSALLMAAVLTASTAIARGLADAPPSQQRIEWAAPAIEQMQWDLVNATVLTEADEGFVLTGAMGLHGRTLEPTQRMVRVRYYIERLPFERKSGHVARMGSATSSRPDSLRVNRPRSWLVREQVTLDARSPEPPIRMLMLADVSRLEIDAADLPHAVELRMESYRAEVGPTEKRWLLR